MCREKVLIGFKKLHPIARIPTRYLDSACFDLYSIDTITIPPGGFCEVRTGIALEIPTGYAGFIHTRSGMGRRGLRAHLGVIDPDFRGEVTVFLFSQSEDSYLISVGDRVAQLFITHVLDIDFVEKLELSSTERGERGFGSSGK